MTIDKQTDGNYTITDGRREYNNLQPINVLDYIKTYLIGDITDPRVIDVMEIKEPLERQVVRNNFEVARIKREVIK